MADNEYPPSPGRRHRLHNPGSPHPVMGRGELAVLGGDHERLRDKVEVLGSLGVLRDGIKALTLVDKFASNSLKTGFKTDNTILFTHRI